MFPSAFPRRLHLMTSCLSLPLSQSAQPREDSELIWVLSKAVENFSLECLALKHHFWLNFTEIRDAENMTFLDSPVSPKGLFSPTGSSL